MYLVAKVKVILYFFVMNGQSFQVSLKIGQW